MRCSQANKPKHCYMASIAAGCDTNSARCVHAGSVYPSVIVHQAAPVPHLHHGLEAEDGLLVEAAALGHSEGPGRQLEGLVSLGPGKLLLPYLYNSMCRIQPTPCFLCALFVTNLGTSPDNKHMTSACSRHCSRARQDSEARLSAATTQLCDTLHLHSIPASTVTAHLAYTANWGNVQSKHWVADVEHDFINVPVWLQHHLEGCVAYR